MLKTSLLSIVLAIIFLQASSQELYMPRDIKLAYQKGTRSPDGRPGKNYWQNFGRYKISISVSPPNPNVKGTEQIVYVNNSPDTLSRLNMKLIMNIHRPGAARFSTTSSDYLTDGIQVDTFK